MPLSLNPSRTAPVYLDSDLGIAEAERPAFLFKFLTAREVDDIDQQRQANKSRQDVTAADLVAVIAPHLKGWRNMGRTFGVDALPDILTFDELGELYWTFPDKVTASERDLKKSASQSPSATAESAGAPASTTAEQLAAATAQPSPSPAA